MASPLPPPPSDAVPAPAPDPVGPSSRRRVLVAGALVAVVIVAAVTVFVTTRGGNGGDESAGGWNTIARLDDTEAMTLLDADGEAVDTVDLGRPGTDLRLQYAYRSSIVLYDSGTEELVVVDTAEGELTEYPLADDAFSVRPVRGSDSVVFAGSSQGGPDGVFVDLETGDSIDLADIGAPDDAIFLDTTAQAAPGGDAVVIVDVRARQTAVMSFEDPSRSVTVPGSAIAVADDRIVTSDSNDGRSEIVFSELGGEEVDTFELERIVAVTRFDDGSVLAISDDGTIRRLTEGSEQPEEVGSIDLGGEPTRGAFSADERTRFVVLTETAINVIDGDGQLVGVIEGNDASVRGRVGGRCLVSGENPFVVVDTEDATVLADGEGELRSPARQVTPDGCVVVVEYADESVLAGRVSASIDGRAVAVAADASAVIVGGDDAEGSVRLVDVVDGGEVAADDGIELGPCRATYVFVDR